MKLYLKKLKLSIKKDKDKNKTETILDKEVNKQQLKSVYKEKTNSNKLKT